MDTKQSYLKNLHSFIEGIDKEVTMILQSLQWDRKHLLEGATMVSCKHNRNHKVPPNKKEEHEKDCLLKSQGYSKSERLLPDPLDPNASTLVKLCKADIEQIINNASKHDPSFRKGAGSQGSEPLTVERLQATYSADERRAIHDAVVSAVPSCHDLADLALQCTKDDEQTVSAPKSRLEILAELRDMRRRRAKYRGSTKSRNYSDVLRDVITTQMELYTGVPVDAEEASTSKNDVNIDPGEHNRKEQDSHSKYPREPEETRNERRDQSGDKYKDRENDIHARKRYDDYRTNKNDRIRVPDKYTIGDTSNRKYKNNYGYDDESCNRYTNYNNREDCRIISIKQQKERSKSKDRYYERRDERDQSRIKQEKERSKPKDRYYERRDERDQSRIKQEKERSTSKDRYYERRDEKDQSRIKQEKERSKPKDRYYERRDERDQSRIKQEKERSTSKDRYYERRDERDQSRIKQEKERSTSKDRYYERRDKRDQSRIKQEKERSESKDRYYERWDERDQSRSRTRNDRSDRSDKHSAGSSSSRSGKRLHDDDNYSQKRKGPSQKTDQGNHRRYYDTDYKDEKCSHEDRRKRIRRS